ncbi:hypothetical protein EF847_11770 [Actinobacteria bacterium YIM 96077]|uniref:Uncharacterized protein n=1 Tax=Phytoactinopolyspora halophila TaxID=1981511 RepID=A0A329QYN2_9ACTN|nr:hypothetical protein [Phytoactinopolyspora halophila]AYY13273.1 hypothetical protein EF847_11770 [Actinobacteria bacterium YIM 96077]RAW17490.1 hypothetical protein DPM12_05650 [Phytoactinopolyspora halophila]
MTDDRRTKQDVTPGEDPREIDRERHTEQALHDQEAQDAMLHRQRRTQGGMGVSSDSPGHDLEELDDAPDVPKNRKQS